MQHSSTVYAEGCTITLIIVLIKLLILLVNVIDTRLVNLATIFMWEDPGYTILKKSD